MKNLYNIGRPSSKVKRGGCGVVIIENGTVSRYSQGYALSTSNRMELMAVIVGLKRVSPESVVTVFSDSTYVVDGMRGWLTKWQNTGWRTVKGTGVLNKDLWMILADLREKRRITFHWVKGHSGDKYNEECDALAKAASRSLFVKQDLR